MIFGNPAVTYKAYAKNLGNRGRFGRDHAEMQRVYDVSWADRQDGVRNLLGDVEVDGDATKFYRRTLPHALPDWMKAPGKSFQTYLFCDEVEYEEVGVNSIADNNHLDGVPKAERVRLYANYRTSPFDIRSDEAMRTLGYTVSGEPDESTWKRYVTKQIAPAGQFFTLPTGTMRWVSDGRPVEFGVSKQVIFYNAQITHHYVPETAIPCMLLNPNLTAPAAIDVCLGKVNHEAINSFDKGTLLMIGAQFKPYINPYGRRMYDWTAMLKYFEPVNDQGHQYVFRPQPGGGAVAGAWIEVTTDGLTNLVAQNVGESVYDWAKDAGKTFKDMWRPKTSSA